MKHLRLVPLFLVVLAFVVIIPQINQVHASGPLFVLSNGTTCGEGWVTCSSGSVTITSGNVMIVFLTGRDCGCGGNTGLTVTDSLGNVYTSLGSFGSTNSATQVVLFRSALTNSGTGTVTLTSTNGVFSNLIIDEYSGVVGFGSASGAQLLNPTTTTSLSITTIASVSLIYEVIAMQSTNGPPCPTYTASNGQSAINSEQCNSGNSGLTGLGTQEFQLPNLSPATYPVGLTVQSSNLQVVPGQHVAVELQGSGNTGGGTTLVTQCYGNCGNPAITITNPNATHTINFNQSLTIFYEFQSNLNGVLLNATTNLAKTYTNGNQIALGVYTASCPVGVTPFTIQCAGALQQGSSISNSNPPKGRRSINAQVPVVAGQWIAIAVSGVFSGLDLNETNGTCGDGTSGVCNAGMFVARGIIPQIISSSIQCSSSVNSGCNVGSISTTGLWAWIQGNVVINAPVPPPSIGCQNVDLACFLVASACGLTPSNCFVGGAIIMFIYFAVFVVSIVLATSYINREYEQQIQFPPSLFFLFFLLELFMFTAIGLVPQYVTIVIFILTGLGVAGYFGSGFMGRSKSE